MKAGLEKAWGNTPVCERWCAGEVLSSAVSVEMGDGDPCGSRDTRDIDVLETTEVPENHHMEGPA